MSSMESVVYIISPLLVPANRVCWIITEPPGLHGANLGPMRYSTWSGILNLLQYRSKVKLKEISTSSTSAVASHPMRYLTPRSKFKRIEYIKVHENQGSEDVVQHWLSKVGSCRLQTRGKVGGKFSSDAGTMGQRA